MVVVVVGKRRRRISFPQALMKRWQLNPATAIPIPNDRPTRRTGSIQIFWATKHHMRSARFDYIQTCSGSRNSKSPRIHLVVSIRSDDMLVGQRHGTGMSINGSSPRHLRGMLCSLVTRQANAVPIFWTVIGHKATGYSYGRVGEEMGFISMA